MTENLLLRLLATVAGASGAIVTGALTNLPADAGPAWAVTTAWGWALLVSGLADLVLDRPIQPPPPETTPPAPRPRKGWVARGSLVGAIIGAGGVTWAWARHRRQSCGHLGH